MFDDFEVWCNRQTPKTKQSYLNSLKNLKNYFKDKDVTALAISQYAGPNHDLRVLRRMLNLAVEWGYLEKAPKVHVKQEKERTRFLTHEEKQKLIRACGDPEIKLMVQVALLTGLRKSNVLSLKWEQIKFDLKEIHLQVKADKALKIPIPDDLITLLQNHRKGRLFISAKVFEKTYIDKKFRKIADELGLNDIVFHSLRHSFASELVKNDVHIRVIADLLGHRDIRTTMRYTHVDMDSKREAVNSIKGVIA